MARRTFLEQHEKEKLENWLKENINNPLFTEFKKVYPTSVLNHNTFKRYRDRIKGEMAIDNIANGISNTIEIPTKRHYTPRQNTVRTRSTTPLYQTIGIIDLNETNSPLSKIENLISLINDCCGTNLELVNLANGATEIRRVQR